MSCSDRFDFAAIVRRTQPFPIDHFRELIHHFGDKLIKPNMSLLESLLINFDCTDSQMSIAISIFASSSAGAEHQSSAHDTLSLDREANEEIHPTNWHSIIYGRDEISWQLHQLLVDSKKRRWICTVEGFAFLFRSARVEEAHALMYTRP